MPIQIYNWLSRPQAEFHALAAAGIIVLLDHAAADELLGHFASQQVPENILTIRRKAHVHP